jgi:hypothetical protein
MPRTNSAVPLIFKYEFPRLNLLNEDKEGATESILKSVARSSRDCELRINGGLYTTAGVLNATVFHQGKLNAKMDELNKASGVMRRNRA